jgi:1-acyl-sn-glycerol-3-phosphate acyltransferase
MTEPVRDPTDRAPSDDTAPGEPVSGSSASGPPARPPLPGPAVHPVRRAIRYWLSRIAVWLLLRAYLRPALEGRERLPPEPAIYCLNHLDWIDPFVLLATLPMRPRLYFFGPKEEDMAAGGRNRLMTWTGTAVPYRPRKNDLLDATRRVQVVIDAGGVLAVFGEGRIHASESDLLPLSEGAAYFALRSNVPLVPIAINGTSWLAFGRRVRVRVGDPIEVAGRPTREAVLALTERCTADLQAMLAGQPEQPRPGRFGRWLTELFNDWPEGERPAVDAASSGILDRG